MHHHMETNGRRRWTLLSALATGFVACTSGGWAIPFSNSSAGGTVLVASTGGDYASLGAAATAFNAVSGGINGDWTILIANGSYTQSTSCNFANTVASGKRVTLRPAPGATVSINFSATTGNASGVQGGIIVGSSSLATADSIIATNNFIIDGSNVPGGTSRNLTLTNATQSSFAANVINIYGNCSGAVVRNCLITNNCTNTGNIYGVVATGRRTATPADLVPTNVTIENNVITATAGQAGAGIGTVANGSITAGTAVTGMVVQDNILSARTRGVFLSLTAGGTIRRNNIRVNQTTSGFTSYGIFLFSANNATGWTLDIIGNQIDQLATANTSASNGIVGISVANSANVSNTANIISNMVSGFSFPSGTAAEMIYRGIEVSPATITANLFNNSVNMPNFAIVTGGTLNNVYGIGATGSGSTTTFRNNIVRSLQAGTNSYCIVKAGSTGLTANNNVYWYSSAKMGAFNGVSQAALSNWQTATSQDASSALLDPTATVGSTWVSATDLHWTTSTAIRPVSLPSAAALAAVTIDVDGDPRGATPWVGCDEVAGAYTRANNRAQDSASDTAYSTGWPNSSNGGTGWGGGWTISGSANSGSFRGDSRANGIASGQLDGNGDGDINTATNVAWGLYANSSTLGEAVRPLPSGGMIVGDTIRLNMDNGFIQTGGTVGFSLRNASSQNVLEYYFVGGDTGYRVNDATGSNLFGTVLGYTAEGMEVNVELVTSSTARLSVRQLNGNAIRTTTTQLMNPGGGQLITQLRPFNFNAGSGQGADIYFNSIALVDGLAPLPTISANATTSRTSPLSFQVTFPENVTGLATGDFVITNGTVGTLTGSGSVYTLTVTPSAQGQVTVNLPAGTCNDAAGNNNQAATSRVFFDNAAPTVALTAAATGTNQATFNFTATFTEPVSGVTGSNFTLVATGVSGAIGTPTSSNGGLVWTIPVSGLTGEGTFQVNLTSTSGIVDAAGNVLSATVNSPTITRDTVAPSVTGVTRISSDNTNAASVQYLVTFSEPLTGVSSSMFNITMTGIGTPTLGTVSGSGTDYTVNVNVPSGADGTLRLNVNSVGSAIDIGGNQVSGLPFTLGETFRVDRILPVCTAALIDRSPTSNTATWRFVFSEPVTGVSLDPTDVYSGNVFWVFSPAPAGAPFFGTGPTPTGLIQSNDSGVTWTVTYTGIYNSGTINAAFRYQALVKDLYNNVLNINSSDSATWVNAPTTLIDNTAPTATLTSVTPTDTNSASIPVTLNLGEVPSTTFTVGILQLSNATVSGFTATSSTRYTFNLLPTAEGVASATIPAGAFYDLAGNISDSTSSISFNYDATAPGIAISAPSDSLTRTGPVTFTVTYTGATAVTLSPANVTLNKTGTADAASVIVSGSGTGSRTVQLSGITGDGTIGISIAAGTASDAAANSAPAAGPSATFTVDNTPPSVNIGAPSPSLTRSGPIDFVVTYSGASTVTLSTVDVTVNKTGTADAASVQVLGTGATTRTVRLNGVIGDGTLGISLDVQTAIDAATNAAPAAGPSATATVDNTAPGIAISAPSSPTASTGPIDYTVTYTGADAVSLVAGNVTLNRTGTANGTVSILGSGTATRTVRISSITGDGSIGISIAAGTASDNAGNTAAAAGPSDTFAVGNTLPAVDISAPSPSIVRGIPASSITYTITYSNATAVTLVSGNVTVNATGTAQASSKILSGTGNGPFTVTLSGITGDGTLSISLPANTATNAGQPAPSAVSSAATVDSTSPTVTIAAPDNSIITTGPVSFDVFFNEPVTGFSTTGVLVNRTGTVSGGTVSVSGSGTTYTVQLTNVSGDGTIGISVLANAASDAAGNVNAASAASATAQVDNTAPTSLTGTPSPSVTRSGPVSFPITFSEAVTGFALESDLIVSTTGTASYSGASVTGSGTSYTVTLTGLTGDGQIGVRPKVGAGFDAAGNASSVGVAGTPVTVDNTAPTVVSIVRADASPTNAATVNFTVTFSESVSGVSSSNFTAVFSGATGAIGTVTGSGTTWNVPVSINAGSDGTVGLNATAAGSATDGAGNSLASLPVTGQVYTVDRVAPGVSLSSTVGSYVKGPFTVTATFTEDVTGVAVGDFSVTNGTAGTFGAIDGSTYQVVITPTANGPVSVSMNAAVATDLAGNANTAAPSSVSTSADLNAPTSAADASDKTQATVAKVNFSAFDTGGSGIASVALWVKVPGSGVFVNSGLTTTTASGTFYYTPTNGSGVYEFSTVATDVATNVETLPVLGDVAIAINAVENGPYTVSVPGTGTYVFPMTDTLDTTVTITAASGAGSITISRSAPRSATPAYFQVPGQLLGENLSIARTGLATFTANLEWGADPANVTAVGGGISQVWSFNGGAVPTATFTPASVVNGVITVNGITSFSEWFAGNSVAVPVSLSGLSIE